MSDTNRATVGNGHTCDGEHVGDIDNLADRRAAVTRDAIRRAVATLLATEHPASISVPQVARTAGVSVRTVYRYFPNKQALLDDVANTQLRSIAAAGAGPADLYTDPQRWLPVLWRTFAESIDSIRAQQMSPAGADLRDRRLGQNRVAMQPVLAARHPDLDDERLGALTDALIAVTSSRMFLELHDRMGWDVDAASALSVWMMEALQAHAEEVPA